MDEDILAMIFTFVGSMALLGCLTTVVLTVLRRRSQRPPEADVGRRLDDLADRLARIDGAIDTMAVEVERISEAQRFTARVLADRANSTAPAIGDRSRTSSTTPH